MAMVEKLDAIDPYLTNQAAFMHAHGIRYDGPNYGEELEALRAALSEPRNASPTEDATVTCNNCAAVFPFNGAHKCPRRVDSAQDITAAALREAVERVGRNASPTEGGK
jgi:hypothetical protein